MDVTLVHNYFMNNDSTASLDTSMIASILGIGTKKTIALPIPPQIVTPAKKATTYVEILLSLNPSLTHS